MLIVRRKRGEVIVIGDGIEIEILDISPTQVKVGIRAPKDVPVFRKEIRLARDANVASANGGSTRILQDFIGKLRTANSGSIAITTEPAKSLETQTVRSSISFS